MGGGEGGRRVAVTESITTHLIYCHTTNNIPCFLVIEFEKLLYYIRINSTSFELHVSGHLIQNAVSTDVF